MIAVQRGASNIYFPNTASSILIPPFSSAIQQVLSKPRVLEMLESSTENGKIPKTSFDIVARYEKVDSDELENAYFQRKRGFGHAASADEVEFRHAEFSALLEERRDATDALVTRRQNLADYKDFVRDFFSSITLVEKLTETRALTGFTRVEPGGTEPSPLSVKHLGWLPAFQVRGEGIFLEVDRDRIEAFDERAPMGALTLVSRAVAANRSPIPPTPSLVMLHTLAHLLIKRMSFESGYGASSIRERIYAGATEATAPMSGILLYTAAGDADGTLGGLVGLGRPGMLERLVLGALEDSRWCASDPICIESKGQGPDSMNLAACHACALLPETSCEFQNRTLDRASVNSFFAGLES